MNLLFNVKVLSLLVLLIGCNREVGRSSQDGTSDSLKMTISHYKVPCQGEALQACMLVRRDGGEEEYFYDTIEGFNYEWGHNYTVQVSVKPIEHPMADGPSQRYVLDKVLKKKAVKGSTTFELPLQVNGMSAVNSDNIGCRYLYDVSIDPGTYSCGQVKAANSATFKHQNGRIKVVQLN
jgi:hypothetical protein